MKTLLLMSLGALLVSALALILRSEIRQSGLRIARPARRWQSQPPRRLYSLLLSDMPH